MDGKFGYSTLSQVAYWNCTCERGSPLLLALLAAETFWAIMYYISRTAAMIISLHVFEDDTVAKVTVSKANLDAFFRFVGPCPVLCCFAVLL